VIVNYFLLQKDVDVWFVCLVVGTNTIMDRTLLQVPKECTTILVNMETIGTLRNNLVAAFGQWYIYLNISYIHLPSCFLNSCNHLCQSHVAFGFSMCFIDPQEEEK
jgi:hypothetical protein